MMMFILNHLQYQYINEIDQSFTRKDIDGIQNDIQTWLDSLVNDGMLLYAKPGATVSPDWDFSMNGNQISAKTLDLNVDFSEIAHQLDLIAASVFGKHTIQ